MRGGEAAPPLAEGRYRLISVLGVGGMATVYKGYDARLQVYRAVKVLSPALAKRKSLKARFEAEATTMAMLHHRNIVAVHDIGSDGNRIFIVMELVGGGSVLDRVREEGPLPPRMALHVTIKTLDALKVAHSRGVVHRDIKPHNILLTQESDIRITDFGIAQMRKWEDDDDGLTKTGAVMGTWGFMAPEQRQDAKTVDQRADVYSVGATLYSVLTDKTPVDLFAADMDASMMSDIHPAVAEIIKKATRYNREERYADAEAMAAACRAVAEELPEDPPDTAPLALPPRQDSFEALDQQSLSQAGGGGMVGNTSIGGEYSESDFDSDLDSDVDQISDLGSGTIVPPKGGDLSAPYPGVDSQPPTNQTAVPDDPTGILEAPKRAAPSNLSELRPIQAPLERAPTPVPSEPPVIRQLPAPERPPPSLPPQATPQATPVEFWITSVIAGMSLIALILVMLFLLGPRIEAWLGGESVVEVDPEVGGVTVDGAGEDGVGEDRAGEDGVGEDGVGVDGVGVDGAGEDGAGEDGVGEDGVGEDGAGEDGVGEDGATGGSTTGGNATGGSTTGGNATGGNATGGSTTGGNATGGSTTGDAGQDGVAVVEAPKETVQVATAPTTMVHAPPSTGRVGQPMTFVAELPTPGLEVIVHYCSAANNCDWRQVVARGSGTRYTATITPDAQLAGGLKYWIQVSGRSDLSYKSGFSPALVGVKQ